MNSTRLSKISRLIQKELSNYFQKNGKTIYLSSMISVTASRVSPDISHAKIYVSIFPTDKTEEVFEIIQENSKSIKIELAKIMRHQLRKMPELEYFIDDSLDYVENIETLLKE